MARGRKRKNIEEYGVYEDCTAELQEEIGNGDVVIKADGYTDDYYIVIYHAGIYEDADYILIGAKGNKNRVTYVKDREELHSEYKLIAKADDVGVTLN